jgi:AcrR family transcriptional regulator
MSETAARPDRSTRSGRGSAGSPPDDTARAADATDTAARAETAAGADHGGAETAAGADHGGAETAAGADHAGAEAAAGAADAEHADPRPPVRAKRGPGRPRAQPLAEQRRCVLDAAREVFAQHGYHGATIERVARVSGTPRPTVYELFGGKDELFAAVVDDSAERVVARLSASFTDSEAYSLRAFVRHNFAAVFELFEHDRDAVTVLLNAERGTVDRPTAAPSEVRRRVLREITEFTRSRWEELGLEIGDSAEIMAVIYFRMAEGLAIRQADDDGWNREAFIDLLTEFTLGGIERLWAQAQDVLVAAGRRTGTAEGG